MKTDYAGHDHAYRKLKNEGKDGWDGPESAYEERKAHLGKYLERMALPRGARLLELGCGAGNVTLWFASLGFQVHGVDISPSAIQWAREKAEARKLPASFSVGNLCTDEVLPGKQFDVIIDGHCLHCIIGADRKRFFALAHRLLPPGGILFVDTMCAPVPETMKTYDKASRCFVHGDIATRYIGEPAAIEQEIRDGGFAIQSSDSSSSPDCPGSLSVIARKV